MPAYLGALLKRRASQFITPEEDTSCCSSIRQSCEMMSIPPRHLDTANASEASVQTLGC